MISRSGATECFDLKDITPVGCCGNKNREVDSPGKLDNIEQGKAGLIESETFKTFNLENVSSLEKRYNELTLPPLLGGSHENFSALSLLPLLVHFLSMRSSPVGPRAGVRFRRLNPGAVLPLSSAAQIPFLPIV